MNKYKRYSGWGYSSVVDTKTMLNTVISQVKIKIMRMAKIQQNSYKINAGKEGEHQELSFVMVGMQKKKKNLVSLHNSLAVRYKS